MKDNNQRVVANWLYFGASCIVIQIFLGGVTRLTGSGLSITEWQPLLGIIPPLTEADWQLSFQKYQQIAQYKVLNAHFSLGDYQSIFFWEWLHRNWARFIGVAFLLPMTYFILQGKISKKMIPALSLLFILGLLQALIGWIMVKSGLNQTAIRVDHLKLAIHFIAALILLCYTLWLAFSLSLQGIKMRHRLRFSKLNGLLLALLTLQMVYGAFMAGSKAAFAAVTWPDMNGTYLPNLGMAGLSLNSLIGDLLNIQFIHRNLAYLILLLTLVLYWRCRSWKINTTLSRIRTIPVLLVCIQFVLGVTTLLHSLHKHHKIYAFLHQFTGISLLVSLLLMLFLNLKRT